MWYTYDMHESNYQLPLNSQNLMNVLEFYGLSPHAFILQISIDTVFKLHCVCLLVIIPLLEARGNLNRLHKASGYSTFLE